MPLWTDAYLGDTTHLTTTEHGAYFLLLVTMWRSKEPVLPDDDKLLARYARLTAGQWKRIRPILEPFFTISSDGWRQGRLTDEWVAVRQHSTKQSDRSKARWLKNKKTAHAVAMPEGCRTDASPSLTLPLPYKVSEEVSKNNPLPPRRGSRELIYSKEFLDWWELYPRKDCSKSKAWEKYARLDIPHGTLIEALRAFIEYHRKKGTETQYIPHAATWLNGRMWEADYTVKPTQRQATPQKPNPDGPKTNVRVL